jgi:hypothetical protein
MEPSGLAFGKPKDRLSGMRGHLLPDYGAARLHPGYAASTRRNPFHSAVAAPDISTGM